MSLKRTTLIIPLTKARHLAVEPVPSFRCCGSIWSWLEPFSSCSQWRSLSSQHIVILYMHQTSRATISVMFMWSCFISFWGVLTFAKCQGNQGNLVVIIAWLADTGVTSLDRPGHSGQSCENTALFVGILKCYTFRSRDIFMTIACQYLPDKSNNATKDLTSSLTPSMILNRS